MNLMRYRLCCLIQRESIPTPFSLILKRYNEFRALSKFHQPERCSFSGVISRITTGSVEVFMALSNCYSKALLYCFQLIVL